MPHLSDASVACEGLNAVCGVLGDVEIFHDSSRPSGTRVEYHPRSVVAQLANVGRCIQPVKFPWNVSKVVLREGLGFRGCLDRQLDMQSPTRI